MESIVGSESNGTYNQLNGGKTFSSYDQHPFGTTRNYGYGIAAGRYQFMPGTWGDLQKKYGYTDFSPKNQDDAAWRLAQDRYRARTGDDLQTDLEAGKYEKAGQGLNKVWTSLPGGKEANSQTSGFVDRVKKFLGQPAAVDNSVDANGVPTWASEGEAAEVAKESIVGDDWATQVFVRIAVGVAGLSIMGIGLVKMKF